MTASLWPAPAKLNLFLRVTGRRPDGYHSLQTVFQFLDLADEVELGVRGDGAVHRVSSLPGVPPEEDLVVRAARLLQAETGTGLGVDLVVRKRIPAGGGLGGGSSDAATTLVALDRLWGLGLGVDRLAALGLRLGADVPVFVRGHAAWAEGVGEVLEPVALDEPWYLVVDPGCAVSTAAVFADPQLTRDSPLLKIRGLFHAAEDGLPAATAAGLLAAAGNDCNTLNAYRWDGSAWQQLALDPTWASKFSSARAAQTEQKLYPDFRLDTAVSQLDGHRASVSNTVGAINIAATDTKVKAFVGDFSAIRWGIQRQIGMELIEYGDPDGGGDLKRNNQVAFRAEVVYGWGIATLAAFAKVVDAVAG